ncbi:MAG: zinc finger-like domain-containing protein [Planctomycetales bacterium]|nr:zinc finger-like domain-containing protein [Planctomycetales bacterium]
MTDENPAIAAMACPHCHAPLYVRASDLGTKRTCPKCHKGVKVPVHAPSARSASSPRDEFPVVCRTCHSRLYARPEQIGTSIQCPDCFASIAVVAPAAVAERKIYQADDSYDLKLADDEPRVPQPVTYPVYCGTCNTMVRCRPDQQGQRVSCPDCGSAIVVPSPPRPKPTRRLPQEDVDVEIQPTFDRVQQESNAGRLLAAAAAKIDAEDRKKPRPPKRPFIDGVLTFPLQIRVLPATIGLSLLGGVILYAIHIALDMSGLAMIIGMAMMAAISVLGLVFVFVVGNVCMSVVQWTAMGYSTIQDWPEFEIFSWIRNMVFFANSSAVATAPGGLLWLALPIPDWLGHLLVWPTAFVLFPLVFLSMLDHETPLGVYSKYIVRSLQTSRSAWKKFYLMSLLVWGGVALAHVFSIGGSLVSDAPVSWLEYLSIVATVYGAIAYFRLVGRMAWVLDSDVANLAAEATESEADDEGVLPGRSPLQVS